MTKSIRGIIKFRDHIVLVKRIVADNLYYVLPGGHNEKGESEKKTCIREVFEETGLKVLPTKKVFVLPEGKTHKSIYYTCQIENEDSLLVLPTLNILGEEIERNKKENSYEPVWLDLRELNDVKIYPEAIRDLFLNDN